MQDAQDAKQAFVFQTCLLLVNHISNLVTHEHKTGIRLGYHSRIFDHILHPQRHFVYLGKSEKLVDGMPMHPEHVVPCSYMIYELEKLIKAGQYSNEDLARALQKNWKVVYITKEEANYLDFNLKLKSTMPENWDFMTDRPEERLELAGIKLILEPA